MVDSSLYLGLVPLSNPGCKAILISSSPLGPPQLPCPTKNELPTALVYTSPPLSASIVSVSITVPARPLSYTPRTLDRSSKFLPALVGGKGLKKIIDRCPSTMRRLSNLGTLGIGVATSRAKKSMTSWSVCLKAKGTRQTLLPAPREILVSYVE